MIKLTFSKKMKVVAVASGIFLSAAFLFGFLFFLFTEVHPAVTWGLMLPLFILSGTLSVFSVLDTVLLMMKMGSNFIRVLQK